MNNPRRGRRIVFKREEEEVAHVERQQVVAVAEHRLRAEVAAAPALLLEVAVEVLAQLRVEEEAVLLPRVAVGEVVHAEPLPAAVAQLAEVEEVQ